MKYTDSNNSNRRTKLMIRILTGVVIFLVLFIAYFFLVQPQFNKYAYNKQVEGANFVYLDIINKVQSQGYYSIPVGNQTLVLVPYVPTQEGEVPQQ